MDAATASGQSGFDVNTLLGGMARFGESWLTAKYASNRPAGSTNTPGDAPREVKTDTTNDVKKTAGGSGTSGALVWVGIVLAALVIGFVVGKAAGAIWGSVAGLVVLVLGAVLFGGMSKK